MSEVIPANKKKLAIIDGKSVFYRGYFAMSGLSTKDGTPTGGVYGFATMALEVIKRLKPDYVAVAWDKPKTNIRKRLELYPEYKAGRKPPPPDFYEQIPILHELLGAFGWPLYELDDYEADDIMGTLATQAAKQDIETMLITSDLDMLQLVGPHIHVFALKTGLSNIELYSPKSFEAKYGIKATQFLDMKALKGDSSDNIPGVPGIGEKGAIELIKQYETLDGVYDNLVLIKDSMRKKLEAGRELAYLSKKLASIWTDAPLRLNLKEVDGHLCDPLKVRDILQRLEFRTLVRQLPEVMRVPEGEQATASGRQPTDIKVGKTVIIDTEKALAALKINPAQTYYAHSRNAAKHGRHPRLLMLSDDGVETQVLDLTKLSPEAVSSKLSSLKSVVGYDIKSTLKALINLGVALPAVTHDVLVGAFLLNSLRREQTLTELAIADLDYQGSSLDDMPADELVTRASEVIAIIKALYMQQAAGLSEMPKVSKLAGNIEWPVIPVLARMEYEGIQLDTEYLGLIAEQLNDAVSDLEQQIYGYADQEFNISSPSQLAEVLFVKMKLPAAGIKKGKTGYSTAASELLKLREAHPIIDFISQYREVMKLKNTYVDTLPLMVDEKSRLHTTFALTIAQTGRLSSNDPNLQNIPVRTELGKKIRTAFVAGPGKLLVSADYSQFELRLAAYLADDKELIAMFNDGADIHTMTAAQVYGRNPEDVTKNMRREAKVVNFGIIYGMSPHGLSVATGMTFEAAKNFIDKYFELRKPLLDYMNHLKEKARTDGYVETLFGRRRPTPDIHSSNFMVRQAAERAAINMPIQGTEADLMKMAMIEVDKKIAETDCMQLLQIHDSIMVECREEQAEDMAKMLKETMENIYKLPVKLDVDTSIGKNWGEL
ncbi:MAG TPA: DNA polymerase I [Candidatus Limnocylindrales bacterium]|nr:DNA polymerase I [Candidatus Limnocylindrales bacterium]